MKFGDNKPLRHGFDVREVNKSKFIAVCDGSEDIPKESSIIMRDSKKGVAKITFQFKALLRHNIPPALANKCAAGKRST